MVSNLSCTNYHILVLYRTRDSTDALQRAKASRRGGRSFVTKLFTKAHAITEADDEVTPQSISQADKETIDLVLSQLSVKKRQLEELDQTILAAITTEQELEDEVTDAEMYHFELAKKIATLRKFSTASTTTRTNQPAPPTPIQQDQPTTRTACGGAEQQRGH